MERLPWSTVRCSCDWFRAWIDGTEDNNRLYLYWLYIGFWIRRLYEVLSVLLFLHSVESIMSRYVSVVQGPVNVGFKSCCCWWLESDTVKYIVLIPSPSPWSFLPSGLYGPHPHPIRISSSPSLSPEKFSDPHPYLWNPLVHNTMLVKWRLMILPTVCYDRHLARLKLWRSG